MFWPKRCRGRGGRSSWIDLWSGSNGIARGVTSDIVEATVLRQHAQSLSIGLLEVLEISLGLDRVGNNCGLSGTPVGRADLAVLVGELKGLDQTENLVDRPSDGKVVDRDLVTRERSGLRSLGID